ncbi:MAG TPA: EamA family transporter [Candidatus Baltobacteraceae bacterium]|nr:EamA family transporter [Candidatus Baltobacteraceae bacterium]
MIIGATVCWGVAAASIKLLFREHTVDPLTLVVVRAYLASLTLLLVLAITGRARLVIGLREAALAAMIGIGGLLVNNYLYFQAINLTSVATALLLQYQAPVLVALYTALVQRQRLSGRVLVSLALTLTGCALIVRVYDPSVLRPNLLGVLAGIGTAFAFAFYILTSRIALRTMGAWTLLAFAYTAASLVWAIILPPWRLFTPAFSLQTWGAFLAIATLGTVVPFGLFISGLKYLPPTQASIISMLEPVVAAVAAYVLVGEILLPIQLLGGVLVLGGVTLVETKDAASPDAHS